LYSSVPIESVWPTIVTGPRASGPDLGGEPVQRRHLGRLERGLVELEEHVGGQRDPLLGRRLLDALAAVDGLDASDDAPDPALDGADPIVVGLGIDRGGAEQHHADRRQERRPPNHPLPSVICTSSKRGTWSRAGRGTWLGPRSTWPRRGVRRGLGVRRADPRRDRLDQLARRAETSDSHHQSADATERTPSIRWR
jgi:hypothetical protein